MPDNVDQYFVVFQLMDETFLKSISQVDLTDPMQPPGTTVPHTAFLPIDSWTVDLEQTALGSGSGGAGAGKVVFNPLTITRKIDAMSAQLFALAGGGTAFANVDLIVRTDERGRSRVTAAWRFKLVAIKTIQWSGPPHGLPTETATFEYGGVEVWNPPK